MTIELSPAQIRRVIDRLNRTHEAAINGRVQMLADRGCAGVVGISTADDGRTTRIYINGAHLANVYFRLVKEKGDNSWSITYGDEFLGGAAT